MELFINVLVRIGISILIGIALVILYIIYKKFFKKGVEELMFKRTTKVINSFIKKKSREKAFNNIEELNSLWMNKEERKEKFYNYTLVAPVVISLILTFISVVFNVGALSSTKGIYVLILLIAHSLLIYVITSIRDFNFTALNNKGTSFDEIAVKKFQIE